MDGEDQLFWKSKVFWQLNYKFIYRCPMRFPINYLVTLKGNIPRFMHWIFKSNHSETRYYFWWIQKAACIKRFDLSVVHSEYCNWTNLYIYLLLVWFKIISSITIAWDNSWTTSYIYRTSQYIRISSFFRFS